MLYILPFQSCYLAHQFCVSSTLLTVNSNRSDILSNTHQTDTLLPNQVHVLHMSRVQDRELFGLWPGL